MKGVLSSHVNTRKVRVRNDNQPWMNGEVRKAINNRYKLLTKARSTPRDSKKWNDYRKAKNKCTNMIRAAKVNYWKEKFAKCDSSKSFWSLMKKFNGKSINQHIGPLKNENDTIVTNESEKAKIMNNFFANVGKQLATPPQTDENGSLISYIYRVSPSISTIQFSKNFWKNLSNLL